MREALNPMKFIRRGIEKELLRVNPLGQISEHPHFKMLGSKLTHPCITTDYSEALIELVTPPLETKGQLLDFLLALLQFTDKHIEDEYLWPSSMPPYVPHEEAIAIADFGENNNGKMKEVYRLGLSHRYGSIMQVIAGIHYNFSLNENFFKFLKTVEKSELSLRDYINEKYMGLVRNFLRNAWILPYLFGASPACASSSEVFPVDFLKPFSKESLYSPYATSLRLSELGYHNKGQDLLNINYNSIQAYTETLLDATKQPYPEFEAIGLKDNEGYKQLNTSILQIENEYYSNIRPKEPIRQGERPADALSKRGVNYIEVRISDLNPLTLLGIDEHQIDFFDLFLVFCLLDESPLMNDDETIHCQNNIKTIATEGRDPDAVLMIDGKESLFRDEARQLLTRMQSLAAVLDEDGHGLDFCLDAQLEKINNVELTPSFAIMQALINSKVSYQDFFLMKAKENKEALMSATVKGKYPFDELVQKSLQAFNELEAKQGISFEDYLKHYFNS